MNTPGGPQHSPQYPPRHDLPPFQHAPAAGPPGCGHPSPSAPDRGERVVIDVSGAGRRHLVVGALIGALLGFPAVVAAIVSLADANAGLVAGPLIALVIGLTLSALPVLTIVRAKVLFRKYHLVLEVPGLRWDDPRGTPWFIPWHELKSVLVHGLVPREGSTREPLVSLHLYPADLDHAARHPELARAWHAGSGAYRVKLSFSATYIPHLDAALKRFAPDAYGGVTLSNGRETVPVGDRYPGVREAR